MRLALLTLLSAALSFAQTLSGDALVQALQKGGYIIVMRHTSSPRTPPAVPAADNPNKERELDQTGQATATAMGKALRDLRIPIDDTFSSPTYRAMQTAKYAQFAAASPVPELGDNGQSMSGGTAAQAAWLQAKVKEARPGANTILITHQPNLAAAFPQLQNVEDGESLIFGPGGTLVARVKV